MSSIVYPIFCFLLASLGPLIYFVRATLSWPIKHHQNDRKLPLPPGPPPLPIVGNLHMLSNLPHRTLYNLAKKYGPIMSMKLGQVTTIVVSSPQAADLFLKTYDTIFASRPKVQASIYMSYGNKGIAFSEYGPYWRDARKLCTLQLLSASKIQFFALSRREEVGLFVDLIKKAAVARQVVDISALVGNLIQNMTYRMLFGKSSDDEIDLMSLVKESAHLAGPFNIADYLPFFASFDLQGLTKRMKAFSKRMDKVLEKILHEHEEDARWQKKQQRDIIDVLLSLMNHHKNSSDEKAYAIDRTNIKAILLDLIIAGIDTSAITIDWTFSELLRHPHVMKCIQEELGSVVGMNRMVNEKDLPKLTYLDMVIKESFRLHPVAPVLLPHQSMEDITIDVYYIPKNARIIVNAWAIGRDPDAWSGDVEEFLPERFKDRNIDLRGHDFQLIPFSSGRRACPGMQLGLTVVKLVLAQLVHCFNWELPNGMLPEELDMKETFGLGVERAIHLLAMPSYRLPC